MVKCESCEPTCLKEPIFVQNVEFPQESCKRGVHSPLRGACGENEGSAS